MRAKSAADVPLHQRIRADIEAEILSGAWGPGHRLPFEHELMQRYGCARMTVSKVMASLAEAGLIERRRRAGSFVRRPPGQSAVLEIPDIKAEVTARGQAYDHRILSAERRASLPADRDLIALASRARLIAIECLHVAAGEPFAFEDRRISLDAVPEAVDVDFRVEPPGTWLLAHVPWHEAEHRITAVAAEPALAARMALPPGAACLRIDRRTWRSGTPLTGVRIWVPGDRLELVARFTPAGAPRRAPG